MEELLPYLQPMLDLLGAKYGWFTALIGWMGTFRLLIKPVSRQLQTLIARMIAFVQSTRQTDDDELIRRVLGSLWYRGLAMLLDFLASVKLPLEMPEPQPPEKEEQTQL